MLRQVYKTAIMGFMLLLTCNQSFAASINHYLLNMIDENEQIQEAKAKAEQYQKLIWKSKSDYLPQVNLEMQYGKEDIDRESGSHTALDRSYASLKATQLITDFGKTSSAILKAETISKNYEYELKYIKDRVLLEGIKSYLAVIQAREKLKYAKKSESNILKQTGIEEILLKKGAGVSSNVLQVKAQLAGAQALRVRAEGELVQALNKFQKIFDTRLDDKEIDSLEKPVLPSQMIPLSLQDCIDSALNSNSQIDLARIQIEVANKDIDIKRSGMFPRINLFGELKYRENDAGIKGYRKDASGGIELNCNLFEGGGSYSELQAFKQGKQAAVKNYEYVQKGIEEQARNDWSSFLIQSKNHELLQNQAEIVKSFLDIARKERKLGNRSLLDILSGETEYINAISDSVSAEILKEMAVYQLLNTIGKLNINIFE